MKNADTLKKLLTFFFSELFDRFFFLRNPGIKVKIPIMLNILYLNAILTIIINIIFIFIYL